MDLPRARVLVELPYPIAYPYSLVFAEETPASARRWALCFTGYQVLRTLCLPLVGQYLRSPIDEQATDAVANLNRAIAAIRSPFYSDWITLLYALRRYLPRVGLTPLFSSLSDALNALKEPTDRPVGMRGNSRLAPLEALLALRNGTAHGGMPDENEALRHLDAYVLVLHQVLAAFDFLGEHTLYVLDDDSADVLAGMARVRALRGVRPGEPAEMDLDDATVAAFEESPAILVGPASPPMPLYPLFQRIALEEPLYLYDGHYGIRVGTRHSVEERSYIYFLGVHHRAEDASARSADRLRELLARRNISFSLTKDQAAPWTIADSAADYSRRTLFDLVGTKYFPACYVPFRDLERHLAAFLPQPALEISNWGPDTTRKRFVAGLVLVGLAGSGKTALLAHLVERLLARPEDEAGRDNPNLVLFLRGNGVALRPGGMSLFADVAEKLGLAVEGAATRASGKGGFSSFRELLDHLHGRWKQDRVSGRRLILVLDALNEAPFAEQVIREALEMIGTAACYPWCKLILSTRQEWLSLWSAKQGAQETSPLEELRPWLYADNSESEWGKQAPPIVTVETLRKDQAREVYERYQATHKEGELGTRVPACRTPWEELPVPTRQLLASPLHLHLFMEAFDDQNAEPVRTAAVLFRRYVDRTMAERPGLGPAVEAVLGHLLGDLSRPTADLGDDDCHAIRQAWVRAHTPEEARLLLSPVEALAHEGLIGKRVREEGGGYRFTYQQVAAYLVYRHLAAGLPTGADEVASWRARAKARQAFTEYALAFGFLLREWARRDQLGQLGTLLEGAPPWLADVAATLLVEQARSGYVPGKGSREAEKAAGALAATGKVSCASVLHVAAYQLTDTRFGVAAGPYYEACIALREPVWASGTAPEELGFALGRSLCSLAELYEEAGRQAEAEATLRKALAIFEALARAHPDYVGVASRLAQALTGLGWLLDVQERVTEAEDCFREALEVRERLWAEHPDQPALGDGLAVTLAALAGLHHDLGRDSEAEACHLRALQIREALHKSHPQDDDVARGLAHTLDALADLWRTAQRNDEAAAAYRRAIEILRAQERESPEDVALAGQLAWALTDLGLLYSGTGRLAEAEAMHLQALEVREGLWATNPEVVRIGQGLVYTLSYLGSVRRRLGKLAEASEAYERAASLVRELAQRHPHSASLAWQRAWVLSSWGRARSDAVPASDVEAAYRQVVAVREAVWGSSPDNVAVGRRLASALVSLGWQLRHAGRTDEAEGIYRRAADVRSAVRSLDPKNVVLAREQAASLYQVGKVHAELGQTETACQDLRRALETFEALTAACPTDNGLANSAAWAWGTLGACAGKLKRLDEAVAAMEKAVAYREGLLERAPQDFRRRRLAMDLHWLGYWQKAAERLSEAEASCRRAIALREGLLASGSHSPALLRELAQSLNNLGVILRLLRRPAEAITAYQRAEGLKHELHRQQPDNPAIADELARTRTNLGRLLGEVGKVTEAVAVYRGAIDVRAGLAAAQPDRADVQGRLARTLEDLGLLEQVAGRRAAAEKDYLRALQVRKAQQEAGGRLAAAGAMALTLNRLGVLRRAMGRTQEAEATYRDGLGLYEELWREAPSDAEIGDGLARVCSNLGNLYRDTGRSDEAGKAYERAVQVREGLLTAFPRRTALREGLAQSLHGLGSFLFAQGHHETAEAAYLRALRLREQSWADGNPGEPLRDGLAQSLFALGGLWLAKGARAEAEEALRRAVALREALWTDRPGNLGYGQRFANALERLAGLCREAGNQVEADRLQGQAFEVREALQVAETRASDTGPTSSV